MSRPIRIIQAETCYLVSHTGLSQYDVFQQLERQKLFLSILSELPKRYAFSLHAFAFNRGAYYLYIKTHRANLDKIMRQLNGLFTSEFQRLQGVEGPVFRGRYRAVVIEPLRYRKVILHYLHSLEYLYNSRDHYLDKTFPAWMSELEVVESDDFAECFQEVADFFAKQRWPAILGSRSFKRDLLRRSHIDLEQSARKQLQVQASIDDIVDLVAKHFRVSGDSIFTTKRGRGQSNVPRAAAMLLCRDYAGYSLKEIAQRFKLSHYASVSSTILRFNKAMRRDGLLTIVFEKIKQHYQAMF